MKRKTAFCMFCICTALQACSQGTFSPKRYPFPIPLEAPPMVTMQEEAEEQVRELERMTGDPFAGKTELTVKLGDVPDGKWCYPLPGSKVISPYGNRNGRKHTGVDIKTKPNDSIRAVFDGIVTMSQPFAAYGNCVVVRHGNGLETLYSHNVRNLVWVGSRVKAGQVIALTGRTGRATTEHLHFELRVAGKNYDPTLLFDHNTKKLNRHTLIFTKNGSVKVK